MTQPNGPFRVVFTQAGTGANRAVRFASDQPSWLVRAAAWAVMLAIGLIALLLIVPILVLAFALFAVLALVGWVRLKLAGTRSPGGVGAGPRDGRRNVRVITRSDP
ncbi:MAG: hypothetical protein RIB60_00070 [Phycisphaerales bacterium]